MRSLILFLLIVIIVVLWLDEIPLLLSLDSGLKRSVRVSLSVVSNESVPPEVVDTDSAENNVGVVSLMVVANP